MIARFESYTLNHSLPFSVFIYRNLQNLMHWHKESEIIHIFEGSCEVMISGKNYLMTAGESAFIKEKEIHTINSSVDSVVGVIKADMHNIKKITDNKSLNSAVLTNDYQISDLFYRLISEKNKSDEFQGIIAECIITKLTAEIFRNEVVVPDTDLKKNNTNEYIELLDYIERNYAYISFEDACRHMHLTPAYFSKLFKKITGSTFTHYLNTLKVSAAIIKISKGEKSMTKIAYECGFGTIRSFNRTFKELTGHSPKQLPGQKLIPYNTNDGDLFDPTLSCTEIIR